MRRALLLGTICAAAALAPAAVARAQKPADTAWTAWRSQTEEFRAYLEATDQLPAASRALLDDPTGGAPGGTYVGSEDVVNGKVGLQLFFVDATRKGRLKAKAIDEVVFDLNTIYGALPRNRYGLTEVYFCSRTTAAPAAFAYDRAGKAKREWTSAFKDVSAFDFVQWDAYRRVLEAAGPKVPPGAVAVVVVDGVRDLTGFTLGAPGATAFANAVVVDVDILAKVARGRTRNKFLAQLIANSLGLRSLWHAEALGGDGVDDTPQHNRPNVGSYGRSVHYSLAAGLPRELVDNVMDNTDDDVGATWTPGQVEYLYRCLRREGAPALVTREGCADGFAEEGKKPAVEHLTYAVPGAGPSTLSVTPSPATAAVVVEVTDLRDAPSSSGALAGDSFTGERRVVVYDASGREVLAAAMRVEAGAGRQVLDVSGLPSGAYHVVVQGDAGAARVARTFLKQ